MPDGGRFIAGPDGIARGFGGSDEPPPPPPYPSISGGQEFYLRYAPDRSSLV